jgi:hypothetical protein
MTKIFAALHAMSAGRDRGSAAVDLGLVGALVTVTALAAATLFNGHLLGALE